MGLVFMFIGLIVKQQETKMTPQTNEFLWTYNDKLLVAYRTKRRLHVPPVISKEYENRKVRQDCKVVIKMNT